MRITQYELDDIYDPHDEPLYSAAASVRANDADVHDEPFYSAAASARANDADAHDEPFLFGSSKR